METKQQILKAIEDLPDDATVEDASDRLYLLYKIERGLRQADRGELISQEEARQRMARWLKEGGRYRLSMILRRSAFLSLATHRGLRLCLLIARSAPQTAWYSTRVWGGLCQN